MLHIVAAAFALWTRDMAAAVISMALFSLFSSVLFFYLHAPDVALTEAAIGTGISTFIYVWAVQKTGRRDET